MQLKAFLCFSILCSFFTSFSQKLYEDKINVSTTRKKEYHDAVIYLPAGYSKHKTYPLVIFTHGMGEAGKNIKKLYNQGLPRVLKKGYRPPFDFIMVAVQRRSFSAPPEWLPGILNDCQQRWNIDNRRIYLTGLSAGGWSIYGSQLNISVDFAKKFAAIVVNSGVTTNANRKHFDWWKQTKTPLWAIVGERDRSYVAKNYYMVNEINKRVPRLAHMTVRRGVGHGGWGDIYDGSVKLDGKNMWEWMYQFKRGSGHENNGDDDDDGDVEETPPGHHDGGNHDDDDDDDDDDDNDKPGKTTSYQSLKVNIFSGEHPSTNTTWNNWNVGARTGTELKSSRFKYTNGSTSGITATLSRSYEVVDNGRTYGSGQAPASVLRFTSYDTKDRMLTFSGLSTKKTYTITLYASRRNKPGNTTRYRIGSRVQDLATNNNHTAKAYFGSVEPDAQGRIKITIENLNVYNYINGFMIVENEKD